jgi:hypothetical protein
MMQREIIRLNGEISRLRKQLQDAHEAAPAEQKAAPAPQGAAPAKHAVAPARRAVAKPKAPKTRDCPNPVCKHGMIYLPWWRIVPVGVGGAWGYFTIWGRAPAGMCGVCGGKGRVESSLANREPGRK